MSEKANCLAHDGTVSDTQTQMQPWSLHQINHARTKKLFRLEGFIYLFCSKKNHSGKENDQVGSRCSFFVCLFCT